MSYLLLVMVVIYTGYYVIFVVSKPKLVYRQSELNRRILAKCPKLLQPYKPTPWMVNTHLQLIFLGLKKVFAPRLEYDEIERLSMDDGGTTAIEWLGMDLPESAPTVIVLHTITGSSHSMRSFVRDMQSMLGWRVAVCIRRGHAGESLTSARLNTMGCAADFRHQLAHIQTKLPASPLFAVGISAGSAVLVRYLGEEGGKSPLKAGVAYCPGYDISIAFSRARPFYSAMMTKKLIRKFLTPHRHHFEHLESFERATQAKDLHEFHQSLYGIAGFESHEAYLEGSNPISLMDKIEVPVMVINSEDDPVCVVQNAHEHSERIENLENGIQVITGYGSHCAFFEGWGAAPWANRLIADYFRAVAEETKP